MSAKLNLGWYYFRGYKIFDNGELASNSLLPDETQALLWWGRAAAENNPTAKNNMALMMERGYGLPSPQPEIAERYYRLAAHGGNEDAEIERRKRLRGPAACWSSRRTGTNEAIDLLNRALSHGSARAAKMLAEIYRNGELDQAKDPLLAMKYAFLAIKLSVQADPSSDDGNPFYEMGAGILLAEMAVNGQAVDVNDRGLLNPDEIDRLQRFYGTVDPRNAES